jgi:hypothetical protein
MLAAPSDERPSESAPPSGLERQRRLGHGALLINMPTGTEAAPLDRLERRLFDAGFVTAQAADESSAMSLLHAGLVVLSTTQPLDAKKAVTLSGANEADWWRTIEPLLGPLRDC